MERDIALEARVPSSVEALMVVQGRQTRLTAAEVDCWLSIYRKAGLVDLETRSGPFEMMTPRGFLDDEGILNGARVVARTVSQRACARRMLWLMPRIARAVPYLGYLVAAGHRPVADEVLSNG